MTTHLRARALQAGALMALVGGMLVVAASPAQAAPPEVEITSVSSTNIASGERTTVQYRVSIPNSDVPGEVRVRIGVNGGGMNCSRDCSPAVNLATGNGQDFTAELTAPAVDPGATKTLQVQVTARIEPGNENAGATETITVRGPDKPQQVRQISGKIKNAAGKGVSGAQVAMQDSANHKYETTTNGDGLYSFTSSDNAPIAPGAISIGAIKDGFQAATRNVEAAAGRSVNVSLTLASTEATASPTPTATEEASAAPLDGAPDDAAAETADEAAPVETRAASNEDEGSGSLLFVILGGLLVAAGVGAIVLVLMRRRSTEGDDDAGKSGGLIPHQAGGVVPPGQGGGRYGDATRGAAPLGGRPHDQTMVASISGAPSMADAPTMLQRPVPADDEFPDPYGAPAAPPQVTYGVPAAGAYGGATRYDGAEGGATRYGGAPVPAQSGGYDDGYAGPPTQYGRPVPADDPYGAYAPESTPAGYPTPEPQRYDEPTGMYRPSQHHDEGGYPHGAADQQHGYAQEPEYPTTGSGRPEPTGAGNYAGYGQPPAAAGSYGAWSDQAGAGIDSDNAYGPAAGVYGAAPAPGSGTYGAPASGGAAYGAQADGGAAYGAQADGGAAYGAQASGGATYGATAGGGGTYGGQASGGAAYGAPAGGGTYGGGAAYGGPVGDDAPYAAPGGGGGTYGGSAYGAPAGGGGTYGGPAGSGAAYGAPDGEGYDAPPARGGTYGGSPQGSAGTYGGGYPAQADYGHQGGHDPHAAAQYGPDAGGYDQGVPQGYPQQPGAGYQEAGHETPGYPQPGYEQPGYEQPGYDPRQYAGGEQYGAEQAGVRHGSHAVQPQQQPAQPGPRRPADWTDR